MYLIEDNKKISEVIVLYASVHYDNTFNQIVKEVTITRCKKKNGNMFTQGVEYFDDRLFETKEEAEARLKEMEDKE